MRVLALFCALLAASIPAVQAQSAGAFARLGFGARGIALGNAQVADASGATSPYYNPALAPLTQRQSLEASAALLSLDRELQFLQLAAPLRPRAGIAVGLIHAAVTDIDGRDNSGFHTETLSTDEFAFFLAFGLNLHERVSAGIGLQLFRADLYQAVSAVNSIGIDVGLSVRPTEALQLGLVLDDLLARYSWDTSGAFGDDGKTTEDRFPTRLRLGAAYGLMEGRLRLLAEYESRFASSESRTRRVEVFGGVPQEVTRSERLTLQESRLRFGGAYQIVEAFEVRAGLDRVGAEGGGVKPTAGFMVEQPVGQLVLRAEYAVALEPYSLGTLHLLTLRVFL